VGNGCAAYKNRIDAHWAQLENMVRWAHVKARNFRILRRARSTIGHFTHDNVYYSAISRLQERT
jgi:hypothetical protein